MAMIRATSEGDPQTGEQASIRIEGSDTWLPALVPVHAPRGSRTSTTGAVPVVGCFVHNHFVLSWERGEGMVGFKVRRIIYTDVRGVKTRLCGAAQQPRQGCAVRQVTTTMWEWVCGSELTRRGGGDHEQRQKRVWGAKH